MTIDEIVETKSPLESLPHPMLEELPSQHQILDEIRN
jgi:hypothetical protein